jgi:DNA-binding MarR family transcriptional regulator
MSMNSPGDGVSSSLQQFHDLFRQVLRRTRVEWARHVEKEISTSQAIILEKLEREGPQKITELAVHLNITMGAVTGLCDKLIAAEFATRDRDEKDRRVVYLEITPQGLQAIERVRTYRTEAVTKLFKGVSEEELKLLIRIFQQVMDNLD